jgi:hypothetical protein
MISTSLLERQEPNVVGQRSSHGFDPALPGRGLRRTPRCRKRQQILLGGIGGSGMRGIGEGVLTLGS